MQKSTGVEEGNFFSVIVTNKNIKAMIKRTLIVIGIGLAIVFLPSLLGLIEAHKIFSTVPIYIRGWMYIIIVSIVLAIGYRIYWYIGYNI